ncbi:ubiquinol-cytochrome c reductase iron-sulfur subunit [Nocardia inohanensis]|uniref:QcrA and Rieske domain-containing protein n=1 Tax=Nocardia inohanensis TaxID=209246 RepID=UPI00082F11ED|nr:Rieske (2Fe-2S) protein [Nocardia inohanensis]
MSGRGFRRYVEDLLRGRRPGAFRPDAEEAEQLRVAIALRAARSGDAEPSEEFVDGLRDRLAAELSGAAPRSTDGRGRRQVLVGGSVAAAAAVAGATVDRLITANPEPEPEATTTVEPNSGAWQAIAAAADLPEGGVLAFDAGTISGFVRRTGGIPVAVSGVCTHQGCKLWLDAPADRLRCPCHSTSFATDGRVLTHQLPIAPATLPRLRVRENGGAIEVFAPTRPV